MAELSDELVQRLLEGFRFHHGSLEILDGAGETLWRLMIGRNSFTLSGRAQQKAGTWSSKAVGAGRAESYILAEGGATMRGTVTETDRGGDMEIDDVNMVPGKIVTVTSFSVGL